MKKACIASLLVLLAGSALAQATDKVADAPDNNKQGNAAKFAAIKKKMTDAIDERIGKLEELEECIQAAADMKALKACRAEIMPPAKPTN